MPFRYELERELEILHKDLIKLGSLVEESIDNMIDALVDQDVVKAQQVIDNDDTIDDLTVKVEFDCVHLIARQQPAASDLRDIASILKIATDLERIADHSEDISKYIIELSKEPYFKPLEDIPKMAYAVKEMISMAVSSCITKDLELTKKVIEYDDIIDTYFYNLKEEIISFMEKNPTYTRQCSKFLYIIKYLERMGDHATNVAEWILFIITGVYTN